VVRNNEEIPYPQDKANLDYSTAPRGTYTN